MKGEDVGPRGIEVLCDLGKLVGGVVQQAVELGLDGVGLVVDRVRHRLDRFQHLESPRISPIRHHS